METVENFYKEWRWLTYNGLDVLNLKSMIAGTYPVSPGEKYSDNIYLKNYTEDIIDRFKKRNFEVSEEQIAIYDKNIKIKAKESLEKYPDVPVNYAQFYFLRSIFIENCLIIVKQCNTEDLIKKIKRNIIYYHWWDELSFEELSKNIIDSHFISSTQKLIDKQSLFGYFHDRFNTKEDLINHLLSNFIPRKFMIEQMNATLRGSVMFDYRWLFGNEFTKSIRIFENECRFEFNEKIVGSFYNENLLFREIKKNFGKEYTVISQGSPEWLRPQRFDIYFPEINIAVEYQGEQHLYPVDFGGQGEKIAEQQFKENLKRDNIKSEKAKENNCSILYIFPEYDIKNVLSDLKKIIKEKVEN
jgi:hypothetical protein